MSGVASLEWTVDVIEVVAVHFNTAANEEGHGHSNAKLYGLSLESFLQLLNGEPSLTQHSPESPFCDLLVVWNHEATVRW
jgi:hypothetical protein